MEKNSIFSRIGRWGPFEKISESIRNKLLVSLLGLALIPLIIMGGIAYLFSSNALRDNAFDALEAARANKAIAITNHFEGRRSDMTALSETVHTLRSKAFDQLTAIQQLKKNLIENYFRERMNDVRVLSQAPVMQEALRAFERVARAVGSPNWEEVAQAYGPLLSDFNDAYGYYDTYLVGADGNVLYSVARETDLGKSLTEGELAGTPAAKAFEKARTGLAFQDFEPYEPTQSIAAAFMAAPVTVGEEFRGAVMVQMSVDQIDYIMQERTGLGTTGETYVIGPDALFRSNSIHLEEPTIINPAIVVDTEGVRQALGGGTGQGVALNYWGNYVLSAWAPVRVFDTTWALIAEIDVAEAFVPRAAGAEEDFFTRYAKEYDYQDIALINPNGFIFYTVQQSPDYRTNILTGPYSDSNFGNLVADVMETKIFGMADFAPYEAIDGSPAAFFAQPVVTEGQVEVVVVTRISVRRIDEVMAQRAGAGGSSESYLVGPDGLWRSNSRFLDELGLNSTVLQPEVRTAIPMNQGGTAVADNYRNQEVLRSWAPLQIAPPTAADPDGVRWAVVSEIGYDEVRKPVVTMTGIGLLLVLIVAGIVVAGAFLLSRGLTTQVNHINNLFAEIGMGNFQARTPVTSNDEIGEMAESLNAMLDNTLTLIQSSEERDAMQTSIMRLLEEISGLAEGDLTVRAEVTEDFTGAIADSFNEMAEQLGQVVKNVKEVTLQVSVTSQQVSASTESLADTSETQASQVEEAIGAINEMAHSIGRVAESAKQSAKVSEQSMEHSREGAEAVRKTNAAMDSIREYVQETARAIKRLGESSQEVGNIVQLINDIADRTSILALNASIQAAMAGEAGRGFAVVAEEVQRLAERSTNATKQIETLIKNIQGEINEAGSSMEESIQRVVDGSKLADGAYGKLQEIETVTLDLGEQIRSITSASDEQTRSSEKIAKIMEEVGKISSQTSSASRQTALSMKNLSEVSDRLNQSVSVFKLEWEKKAQETGKFEPDKDEEDRDESAA